MFVNMNALKKQAKAAFKNNSLVVGNVEDSLVICTGSVVVQVMEDYATNSFKSLLVEYLGWLPKMDEVYSIGGGAGNQLTVGLDGSLDIYRKYSFNMPQLHRTAVHIEDFRIFQDDTYSKYAVPEELYKVYDIGEVDADKEGFPQPPRLAPDKGNLLYRNDGMALQIKALTSLNSKAFREIGLIDLGEEDDIE